MKNDQNRLSQLKYQLKTQQAEGKKEVIRKLNNEEREFVEETLGYEVIPWLYEITTKTFVNVKALNSSLLKDIHYANKKGRKKIYLRLKRQDIRILEDNGVHYCRFKDKIIL